jgi:hypothetical protein
MTRTAGHDSDGGARPSRDGGTTHRHCPAVPAVPGPGRAWLALSNPRSPEQDHAHNAVGCCWVLRPVRTTRVRTTRVRTTQAHDQDGGSLLQQDDVAVVVGGGEDFAGLGEFVDVKGVGDVALDGRTTRVASDCCAPRVVRSWIEVAWPGSARSPARFPGGTCEGGMVTACEPTGALDGKAVH